LKGIEPPSPGRDELTALQAENLRLIRLLESHGIDWRAPAPDSPPAAPAATRPFATESKLSTAEKVALFRSLFRGRTDAYPVRWESRKTGNAGYGPACGNEWRPGVCEKPRIKCSDCSHRLLIPITDAVIYGHLAGEHTVGVYPLLDGDTCHFLAVDFDDETWRDDARAFRATCRSLGVPAALEVSRSGEGAHVWIFFDRAVPARDARRLGTALISHTCTRTRQLKLESYDRLFPSQDMLPKGGFGNLIALPLQKVPRESGRSVFVDDALHPYPDQWAFLAALERVAAHDIEPIVLQATGGTHPLDVTFIDDEDLATPWAPAPSAQRALAGPMPESLTVTLANQVYFEKAALPQSLANRLIRLAAFQNPEFYRAQAMRMSVWDKPRVIGCARNYPQHIALPRGCLDAAKALLRDNGIDCELRDERALGAPLEVGFAGTLRPDQEAAVAAMLAHDDGVLCAPTAFGKTVTAAAIIARRGVNTLILVHRTELLEQWRERMQAFLAVGRDVIGTIGGGKSRPTGRIDIAVMQSLSRKGEVAPLVEEYGQVIVDECHHIGAASFEAILSRVRARYVLGLTATPIRRDGQQPIIFMQCGPMRHRASRSDDAPQWLEVVPEIRTEALQLGAEAGIQQVFTHLANDRSRTQAIVDLVAGAFDEGRKVLVLTERTDHLESIAAGLAGRVPQLFTLHGRSSKKQRAAIVAALGQLPADAPRIVLATGKLVGEGFDHPPLDTLILAMPISWRGTLQQYAGRLHRAHHGKSAVRIVDIVDTGHPALARMWDKRLQGYRMMGYFVGAASMPLMLRSG
jgi:superfamily II DNA or RNA helicase